MENKNIRICPLCKNKVVRYKHSLSQIMVKGLFQLYINNGRSRLDKLNLSNSEFTNFQKLRYFKLAFPVKPDNVWIITPLGRDFIRGKIKANKYVWTENAVVVERSNEFVFINEIKECVQYKVEWQEQASNPTLFDLRGSK